MKFKNGFLYKSVSIKSISNKVQANPDDLEKFRGARDENNNNDTESLAFSRLLAKYQKKKDFKEGDRVVVLNGKLKSIKGRILKVVDDIAYLKPESEGLPESVAIHNKDLTKIFELGDHVKVVSGGNEANFRRRPPPPPPPPKKGYGFGRVRRDPLVNARIKIRKGPYNGMAGTVVEVRGNRVRVELEAQMNFAYVDRNQIYENMEVDNSICAEEPYGLGGETPMYRPWMTPTRYSSARPIHEGMRTPMRNRAWNP
ncbi:hypothetical protein HAX54_036510 [Datura stramonium]|uniref:KOW domain-containing protein n=1 Tax=Datura stramonium TaxID=4076 RepID=A0ABS8VI92_DATST|nr:hypothetical protein [Datura stramonium]